MPKLKEKTKQKGISKVHINQKQRKKSTNAAIVSWDWMEKFINLIHHGAKPLKKLLRQRLLLFAYMKKN